MLCRGNRQGCFTLNCGVETDESDICVPVACGFFACLLLFVV
jgi:hypothetical protein